jgi:hypothetical protein
VESIRETERITGMSKYLVQKTRDELATLGYITVVKPTPAEARKGQTVHVTLVDRWHENVSRYAKGVSKLVQPPDEKRLAVSKLIQGVLNSIQVKSNFNSLAVSKLIRIDSKDSSVSNDTESVKPKSIPASQMNPMKDAIVAVFRWTWGTMSRTEKGTVHNAAKILCDATVDPKHVPALYQECKTRGWKNFGPMALTKVVSDVMSRLIKLADDDYVPVAQRTSAMQGIRLIS